MIIQPWYERALLNLARDGSGVTQRDPWLLLFLFVSEHQAPLPNNAAMAPDLLPHVCELESRHCWAPPRN